MLFFRTTSKKLARLNNSCGAFEYEVDPRAGPYQDVGMEVRQRFAGPAQVKLPPLDFSRKIQKRRPLLG